MNGYSLTSTIPQIVKSQSGLGVVVDNFFVDGNSFIGGTLILVANGTWYVGYDLYRQNIIALPRLGHRGRIPLAKVITNTTSIVSIDNIIPEIPKSRIPRFIKKLQNGQATKIVVMGSSLTQSDGGNTTWAGMIFGSGSIANYKIPGAVSAVYAGVGASPNQYQLSQLGFASGHTAYGFGSSGYPLSVDTNKTPPNGRSNMFSGVDLVVIGCLANGGEYRIEIIEPLIRKLKKMGVEVIMVTDNVQGPTLDYTGMTTTGALYIDAPEIFRVADLYGVEVADTAAFVLEAHLRYGTGIYADAIHMTSSNPAGKLNDPSCGHEVWARAIRSCIHIQGPLPAAPVIKNYDFASGVSDWIPYGPASVTNVSGKLRATKTAGTVWGARAPLIPILAGDTVQYSGTISNYVHESTVLNVGLQGGGNGWASTTLPPILANGSFSGTLTASRNISDGSAYILFYANFGSSPNGTFFELDDVTFTINSTYSGGVNDTIPNRKFESKELPPIRVVTDYKTPADAFVILPKDKLNISNTGTLGAHPWGSSSFARRWNSQVTSTQDLLTLNTGDRLFISGHNVVALSLIRYQDQTHGSVTFDVRRDGSVLKTMTIQVVPFGNERYTTIFTPSELNQTQPFDLGQSIEILITSGTLRVAAAVCLTADNDYLLPEDITYIGSWGEKENSRSGLPGYPTDALNAAAVAKSTGRRLQWIISGNPGSKSWSAYSDKEIIPTYNNGGNYHIYCVGGLLNTPGTNQVIKCIEANPSGTQEDGHALHIAGAIIINDR